MNIIVKINNQTSGRDKQARLLQYLSKFLWYQLKQNNKDISSFKTLEYQLSTFRKFLRFGRFIESLYASLPLFEQGDTMKYVIILGKIANSLFLLADHILLLGRADFCSVDTEKWSKISNKYWLYSVTMNLVNNFYEISLIIKSKKFNSLSKQGGVLQMLKVLFTAQSDQKLMMDTIKNCCDLFIPLTALGHTRLSPGTVGLVGSVSSLVGLLFLIEQVKK